MPNHITNWVVIEGSKDKIAELAAKTIGKDKDGQPTFDFNGIIQMPEELRKTASPTKIVETQAEADTISAEFLESFKLLQTVETKAITRAEADRRMETYGAINWYDWANRYWGTKWNAYNVTIFSQEPKRIALCFDTAWVSPIPLFDKLEADGFTIGYIWQDEDPSNYGDYGDPWRSFERESFVSYIG